MQDETIDIHGQTLLVTGAAGFIGSREIGRAHV